MASQNFIQRMRQKLTQWHGKDLPLAWKRITSVTEPLTNIVKKYPKIKALETIIVKSFRAMEIYQAACIKSPDRIAVLFHQGISLPTPRSSFGWNQAFIIPISNSLVPTGTHRGSHTIWLGQSVSFSVCKVSHKSFFVIASNIIWIWTPKCQSIFERKPRIKIT